MAVFLAELKAVIGNPKFWALLLALVGIGASFAQGGISEWQAVQAAVAALAVYSTGVAIENRGASKNVDVGYAIDDAADLAVKASEKTIIGSGLGTAKKEAAIELATDYLKARGVIVAESVVSGAVEAAVSDRFPKESEVKA